MLHRFGVTVRPPTLEMGLRAVNVVGEPVGTFKHRWLMIPHDLEASPHREPPPTLLEPSRSQRFVMLDGLCTFGDGKDGFHGFGTGLTFPMTVNGRPQLLAAAVGNILEGFGKFKGREGTYTHCGHIVPNRGFQGNLMCRIMDPEGTLCTEREIPPLTPMPDPEPGLTYILFHGQKRDKYSSTTYDFTPDGQMKGFHLTQELRQFFLDFTDQFTIRDGGDLRARKEMGQVVGQDDLPSLLESSGPESATGHGARPYSLQQLQRIYVL